MSLSAEDIDAVRAALSAEGCPGVSEMRTHFPHLRWAACDASDVEDAPLFSTGGFDVHLLDAREHCVGLTADLTEANGFMLAKRKRTP